MLTEAIKTIQASEATSTVQAAVIAALASPAAVVHLPDTFQQHDLEKFLPQRRRQIGTMKTDAIADFAAFTKDHKAEGATVFVDADYLKAVGVLNLGTVEAPGHADDRTELGMVATAAYNAIGSIVDAPKKQAAVAEFLEDWRDIITCIDEDGQLLNVVHAIEAVRTITIEAARKQRTEVQDYSEESSSLDSIKANSEKKLPARISILAVPFKGLGERTFQLRIGIQTGGQAPMLVLRIIKLEDHKQAMAEELAEKLRAQFADSGVPVVIGTYSKK